MTVPVGVDGRLDLGSKKKLGSRENVSFGSPEAGSEGTFRLSFPSSLWLWIHMACNICRDGRPEVDLVIVTIGVGVVERWLSSEERMLSADVTELECEEAAEDVVWSSDSSDDIAVA